MMTRQPRTTKHSTFVQTPKDTSLNFSKIKEKMLFFHDDSHSFLFSSQQQSIRTQSLTCCFLLSRQHINAKYSIVDVSLLFFCTVAVRARFENTPDVGVFLKLTNTYCLAAFGGSEVSLLSYL
jgi:hypothetical protein